LISKLIYRTITTFSTAVLSVFYWVSGFRLWFFWGLPS